VKNVFEDFPVTESEYLELDKKFGSLCEFEAWQLIKKNSRNNHTDEQQDISQDLRIALLRAGSYYKRQVYTENCLKLCDQHVKDAFVKNIVKSLQHLWKNKTRHGANRQKYGPHQEKILDRLVKKCIPREQRPSKDEPLKIDSKFSTYCKSITWNAQKQLGKQITRSKSIRGGMVSLSEYDYLQ
jgi:hypothetical protein